MNLIATLEGFASRCWQPHRVFLCNCAAVLILFSFIAVATEERLEVIMQSGHSNVIEAVAFSPHSSYLLATGGQDGVAKLWDIQTGKELREISPSSSRADMVTSLAFSEDGQLLAVGTGGIAQDSQNSVSIWSIITGHLVTRLQMPKVNAGLVYGLAFINAGTAIVVSQMGYNTGIAEYDVSSGALLRRSEGFSKFGVQTIAVNKKLNLIATGELTGEIKLWKLSDLSFWQSLPMQSGAVMSLAFSADGQHLAVASRDEHGTESIERKRTGKPQGTVKIWSISSNGKILVDSVTAVPGVGPVAFTPDSKLLLSFADVIQPQLIYFDVDRRTAKRTEKLNWFPRSVAMSSDGKLLASGALIDRLIVYDLGAGKLLQQSSGSADYVSLCCGGMSCTAISLSGQSGLSIWSVPGWKRIANVHFDKSGLVLPTIAVSEATRLLATAGSSVLLWDIDSGREIARLAVRTSPVSAIAFSRTGKQVAVAERDNIIEIFDTKNQRVIKAFAGDHPPYQAHNFDALAFSNNYAYLAAESSDGTLYVWSTSDWHEQRLPGLVGYQHAIVFSPDESTLAASSSKTDVILWNTADWTQRLRVSGNGANISHLTFSADGRSLLLSSGTQIRKLNPSNGKVDLIIEVGTVVTEATFLPGSTYIGATTRDRRLLIYESDGKYVLSFITTGRDDYALIDNDSFYFATKGVRQAVAFRRGNRAYPFEQFDLRLNRPDIVLQRLGTANPDLIAAYHEAYEKRLKVMGVTEAELSDDFHLPELEITTASIPISTADRNLHFRVRAHDDQELLKRVNVYVNDVPLYGVRGKDISAERRHDWKGELEIELGSGANKIQVSTSNMREAESLQQTFDVTYTGPVSKKPDLYVVAVGVSKYKNSGDNLDYAAKDATDLIQFWDSKREYFGHVYPLPLVNQDATKEKIIEAKEFLMRAGVDDKIIVSFAGHGLLDEHKDYYFATTDIDFEHPSRRGLPFEALENLVDGLKARKKLLLIDTCQAGEVDRESVVASNNGKPTSAARGGVAPGVRVRAFQKLRSSVAGVVRVGLDNSFALQQQLFADLRRGSGAQIISASGGYEFAEEGGGVRNGVFTAAVLEGLNGQANPNHSEVVTVSQLREYVIQRVSELTGGQQKPTARRQNLDFDFSLW